MSLNSYHVVPNGSEWAVKKGGGKVLKTFTTKNAAQNYGKNVSINQGAELFIHGKNGQIQNRNSYGNDPFPPRDKH